MNDPSSVLKMSLSGLMEVDTVCDAVRNMLERKGQHSHRFAVDLLLREFVNNAILHGHQADPAKTVKVFVRIGVLWIRIRVIDQGPGFDWRLQKKIVPDTEATSGRGLIIGVHYARRMHYNRKGNQVTLFIRK